MKFFIDTADTNEIKEAQELGVLDGVTTNPSLVAKTGRPFDEVLKEITQIVDGPISAEVHTTDLNEMLSQGQKYAKLDDHIVIKLPLTQTGLKACKRLRADGIRTNVTLCFSANQALLAAKAGASYISPFIGRLDDIGQEGVQLIQEIRSIYDQYDFETEILAASIRHPIHVTQVALLGADVATIPFKVIDQLFKHPLTDIGQEKFLSDWNKSQK
jgi:transaldolase